MRWNLNGIKFLFQPDVFAGKFSDAKMQARHIAMQKEKIAKLKERLDQTDDPMEAMFILEKGDHIRFLLNNKDLFDEADEFEKGVLRLYYRKNTPFYNDGNVNQWLPLFQNCNVEKLRAQGTPLSTQTVTCYRGSVVGVTKGLCWTLDTKYVQKILDSWGDPNLGGGTVFSAKFKAEDIIYHVDNDSRHEVILNPELALNPGGEIITALV